MASDQFFDGREMLTAHDMFRREFGLMPGVVRGVPAGDQERTQVIADRVTSVNDVLYTHHHSEDTHVWPALLQRGSDDVALVVELMEGQHVQIEELSAEAAAALAGWRETATAEARDALADVLDRLVPTLRDHMRLEEERAVPLMEKYITMEEWGRMLQDTAGDIDPQMLVRDFGMMMYEGYPDIIDGAIASMPPEVQPVIRDAAVQAYAAYAESVYGTPTPPRSTEL